MLFWVSALAISLSKFCTVCKYNAPDARITRDTIARLSRLRCTVWLRRSLISAFTSNFGGSAVSLMLSLPLVFQPCLFLKLNERQETALIDDVAIHPVAVVLLH